MLKLVPAYRIGHKITNKSYLWGGGLLDAPKRASSAAGRMFRAIFPEVHSSSFTVK